MSTVSAPFLHSRIRMGGLFRSVAGSLRFSLRELILVMMVCAVLAAGVHAIRKAQRPLVPSHIAEYFTDSLQQDIIAVRAELGEQGEAWSFAPPIMNLNGVYKPEHSLNREWFCDLRLPWEKAWRFREGLDSRIGSHIRRGKAGEFIGDSEHESHTQAAMPNFLADSTKYHCDDVHGTIRVFLARIDEQNVRLITLLSEHRVP